MRFQKSLKRFLHEITLQILSREIMTYIQSICNEKIITNLHSRETERERSEEEGEREEEG